MMQHSLYFVSSVEQKLEDYVGTLATGSTHIFIQLDRLDLDLEKWKMKELLFVKKMHLPIFATQKPESMSDEE
ncbi:hypothetical protein CR513_60012, partial [Mucuna pruriens]